jgi:hypothetical protein
MVKGVARIANVISAMVATATCTKCGIVKQAAQASRYISKGQLMKKGETRTWHCTLPSTPSGMHMDIFDILFNFAPLPVLPRPTHPHRTPGV